MKKILQIFSAVVLAMMISNTAYGVFISEEGLEKVRAWNEKRLAKLHADAEQGDAEAQYQLGRERWTVSGLLARGLSGIDTMDWVTAIHWYSKAAEQGHAAAKSDLIDAQNSLALAYSWGLYGFDEDQYKAVGWYRKAAEQGDANAQYSLGDAYKYGEGVKKDQREAVRWYRMAAEQGHTNAQFNLGLAYWNGESVDEDMPEAVRWFRKAADQGYANAQYNLGYAYWNGKGLDKDPREAVKWYRKAAEQGNASAQNSLGIAYYFGRGVDLDQREAVRWWRKAAEQGMSEAQYALGIAYNAGEGVEKDQREAVRWYRKSAEQGDADAQNNLGHAYWNGEGVVTDKRETYIWLSIAKANGNETAADNLSETNWNDYLSQSETRAANKEAARRMEAIENRETETVEKPSIRENIALAKPSGGMSIAEKVFENAWRSVVIVTTDDGQGSGVIIRPNVVATNCHVVDDGGEIVVYKSDNRRADTDTPFAATIRRANAEDDFCLLDVAGLWGVSATVRRYDTLKVGEAVYGLGAPKGLDLSLSDGLVSQLREVRGTRFIQTNAAISPGSSGGGLFDSEGNLVGIMTLKIADESVEGIGFAIAADLALE